MEVTIFGGDDFRHFGNNVERRFNELQAAINVLRLGLDFGRWQRFIAFAPFVLEECGRVLPFKLARAREADARRGQVRAWLDNFDGDALGMWRTVGRVRSAWARSSSLRIARN